MNKPKTPPPPPQKPRRPSNELFKNRREKGEKK